MFDEFMEQARRLLPGEPADPGRADRRARPPRGGRPADDAVADARAAPGARRSHGHRDGGHGAGRRDVPPARRRWRTARPDLHWGRRGRGEQMRGDEPLGLGDATTRLEELADLDELANALGQDYPGATLGRRRPEAVATALGRQAVDDLRALQALERELERAGLPRSAPEDELELTPRAVRRLGAAALREGLRRPRRTRSRRPRRARRRRRR